jgi:hypothetical protein
MTMEVFEMNEETMREVIRAIEACQGSSAYYAAQPSKADKRQWDYIIRTVCIGCGETLGREENLSRFAYCASCREVLFPETIAPEKIKLRSFHRE